MSLQETCLALKLNSSHIQICEIMKGVSSRDTFNAYWIFCHVESVFARDTFNAYWIFCRVKNVFSRDTFNINPIF